MADERASIGPVRLAIDFGTSHTVAVIHRDGQQPRALLFDGSPLLPSGVYAGPDGDLHTGRDAERFALVDPGGFEPYPKRTVDHDMVLLGRHELAPAVLIGAVLSRVAGAAAEAGIGPADQAVLTCPAGWGRRRRAVLIRGAERAGIRVGLLVDEPVAAGMYCLDILDVAAGQSLVVFDFGGGTLDVAAVRREPGGLRVLATGGLDDLGGLDVDAALVGQLGQLASARDPALWQRLGTPDGTAELRDRRALWAEVRAAKEMLSRTSSAPVPLPGDLGAVHLTRDELDRVAGPLVDRAVDETRRLLRDSRIGPGELAGIFLVGGASRMPLVARKLHARLGVAPAVPEQPELPVAFGALLAADAAPPLPPPSEDAWGSRPPAPPPATTDTGTEPGAALVRPRAAAATARPRRVVAGALAVVTLLVGALLERDSGQHPDRGFAVLGTPNPAGTAVIEPASPSPVVPDGFVLCAGGRLCPTTPFCWRKVRLSIPSETRVVDVHEYCDERHHGETYVAGYLPDAVAVPAEALREHAAIKQLCDTSVLVSRLRDPATSGQWEWKPLTNGIALALFHCVASRVGENERTGSLFRAGP